MSDDFEESFELREDGSFELREDGSVELREGIFQQPPRHGGDGPPRRLRLAAVLAAELARQARERREPRVDARAGGATFNLRATIHPGQAHGNARAPGAVIQAAMPTPDQAKLIGLRLGLLRPGHPLITTCKTDQERLNALELLDLLDIEDIGRIGR